MAEEKLTFNYVVIADLHIGKKDDQKLAEEIEERFTKVIKEYNSNKGLDLIVISGDLFDRIVRLNEYAGVYAVSFMTKLVEWAWDNSIIVRILKGTKTHDYNQLQVFYDLQFRFTNFKIIWKVQTETIHSIRTGMMFRALYIPEEYPSDAASYYSDFFNVDDKSYDMVFGHGMIDFVAFTGYEDDSENPVRVAPVHVAEKLISLTKGPIIFGHIHDYKEYKSQIFYTGSFTRYSFDTQEDKGFLIVEMDPGYDKEYEIFFYENDLAPTYGIINIDNIDAETAEDKMNIVQKMIKEYDFVKIKTDNVANLSIVRKLSEKEPNVKVQKITNTNKEKQKVDSKYLFILEKKYSIEETISRFAKLQFIKEIPINKIRAIIKEDELDLERISALTDTSVVTSKKVK